MRSGAVNLFVWGFINPWVIDHSRYKGEMIFIRGLFILFFIFTFGGCISYFRGLFPREARAEGPSVARLINLSGRRQRSGAKPREFKPKIHLYLLNSQPRILHV